MATSVVTGGTTYIIPDYNYKGWAQGTGNLSLYLIALASTKLDISGGAFTLTSAVDFGASFGITAKSFTIKGTSAPVVAWYSQSFVSQTSVTVTHNLGHQPLVQVLDGSGNLITPDTLNHGSVNAFTVTFNPGLTGTIIYAG